MIDLLAAAAESGWQRGWFEYARTEVAAGRSLDDARAADWTYLVRLGPESRVLLSGPQLLVTAAALAERAGEVWVATADSGEARVLKGWRRQLRSGRVRIIDADLSRGIPFADGTLDLVSIRAGASPFQDVAADAARVLRPGGTARFVADNRLFPKQLAGADRSGRAHTIAGYRRILGRAGLTGIRCFAALPRHTQTPLCLVPLESRTAVELFLRDVFPVFATVSPEVKRAHALEYMLARAGVWVMTRARLGGLLKWFVPGYLILARRPALDAR